MNMERLRTQEWATVVRALPPLPHPHLREGVGEDDERGGQVQGHPLAQVLHRGAEVVGHLVRVLLAAGGFVHLSTRRRAHGGGGRGEIERVGSTKNRLIAYLQWYLVPYIGDQGRRVFTLHAQKGRAANQDLKQLAKTKGLDSPYKSLATLAHCET